MSSDWGTAARRQRTQALGRFAGAVSRQAARDDPLQIGGEKFTHLLCLLQRNAECIGQIGRILALVGRQDGAAPGLQADHEPFAVKVLSGRDGKVKPGTLSHKTHEARGGCLVFIVHHVDLVHSIIPLHSGKDAPFLRQFQKRRAIAAVDCAVNLFAQLLFVIDALCDFGDDVADKGRNG